MSHDRIEVSRAWEAARYWILRPDVEGEYSLDPDDPGGETKFGISKRAYPALDIKNLTREQAAEIYRRDYWEPCQCDELPFPLALAVFDGAVNQGRNASIRLLQLAVESVTGRRIAVDGLIGSDTIGAARLAWKIDPDWTLAAFLSFRADRYAGTIEERPTSRKYRRGWFLRLFKAQAAAMKPLEV